MKTVKKVFVTLLIIAVLASVGVTLSGCGEKKNKKDAATTELNWTSADEYILQIENDKVVSNNDYVVNLEKQPGKAFVVLNFADIQLSDGDWHVRTMGVQTALGTMKELVKEIKPDLITLTGDQTYGEAYSLSKWIEVMDSFEVPWAPTFGNHDNQENDATIAYQAKMYSESKYCVFKQGPTNLGKNSSTRDAIGNYVVNVVERDSSARGFHVVQSILCMNTRDNQSYDDAKYQTPEMQAAKLYGGSYAAWTEEQIAWYKWAVSGVQPYGKDGKVKSTIIQHIPNYEYIVAFDEAFKTDVDKEANHDAYLKEVLSKDLQESYKSESWNEGYTDSYGVRHEEGGTTPYPDGVHAAFLDFDDNPATDFISTTTVVSGHDHVNNYVINYQGVTYVYALKTGSGCYWEKELNGGTIISINDEGDAAVTHKYVKAKYTLIPVWSIILLCVGGIAAIVVCVFVIKKKKKA